MLLVPVTTSEFVIKDLLTFAEDFQTLEFKIVMTSFEIELFFTNIPIFFFLKTIVLCLENLFKEKVNIKNLSKDYFLELIITIINLVSSLILYATCRSSNGFWIKTSTGQCFLSWHENIWRHNCPSERNPNVYKKYIDNTFLLFRSKGYIKKVKTFKS